MHNKPNIYLKNTLTGEKELFKPIEAPVRIYSCGPTLYKFAHIGNLRAYVFADTLNRTLINFGYSVKHVINLTDVGHLTDDGDSGEDKIEKELKNNKSSVEKLIKKLSDSFFADLKKLNIDTRKYTFPRATKYIQEQIDIIKTLEEKGFTYNIDNDGVYFDTSKFANYGKLGNFYISHKQIHNRIIKNNTKKAQEDFALWKFSKENEKRQQEWNSPWGVGFPGWHIECSAMALKTLGEKIDIHTGGVDHIQVHHNNEIAQSESFNNKRFVNYWLHSEFLNYNNEKLSKSLDNTFTLEEIIKMGYHPLAVKYLLLSSNYDSETHFTFESLKAFEKALKKLNKAFFGLKKGFFTKANKKYIEKTNDSIADNLNTPKLLALIYEILKDNELNDKEKAETIKYINKFLGILDKDTLKKAKIPKEIITLAQKRELYKKNKQWQEADVIRDKIIKLGYEIEDFKNNKYKIKEK